MPDSLPDAAPLNRALHVHYVGAGNVASWRLFHAYRAVPHAPTAKGANPPYPPRRLLVQGRDMDLDKRTTRNFRADRVLEVIDLDADAPVSLRDLLTGAGLPADFVAAATPWDAGRFRTVAHGIEFTGAPPGVPGWFFHVPPAFRRALDLSDLEPPSQGWPPAYAFTEGDIFYDDPMARDLPWSEACRRIGHVLEVQSATPDQPDCLRPVRPGHVTATLRPMIPGGAAQTLHLTQADFARLLAMGAHDDATEDGEQ